MGFGVWGLGFGVWGLGFGVWGLGFGVWGLGFGVWGLGFGVWGLGFRVWGLGLTAQTMKRDLLKEPVEDAFEAAAIIENNPPCVEGLVKSHALSFENLAGDAMSTILSGSLNPETPKALKPSNLETLKPLNPKTLKPSNPAP